MAHRLLRPRAVVQHLVAELVTIGPAPLRITTVVGVLDLGHQGGHLVVGEHAAQHGVAVLLELDAGIGGSPL